MTWTAGATRATGDIITATNWNSYWGAGMSVDHLFDGTKIMNDLVYESSLVISNSPVEGARLVSRAAATGGLTWKRAIDQIDYWIGRKPRMRAFHTKAGARS